MYNHMYVYSQLSLGIIYMQTYCTYIVGLLVIHTFHIQGGEL